MAENENWQYTTYGSFPVPYNTETDQYGVTGGAESAQILENTGFSGEFQAFESSNALEDLLQTGSSIISDVFGGTGDTAAPGGSSPGEGGDVNFAPPQSGTPRQAGLLGGNMTSLLLIALLGFALYQFS